MLEPGPELGFPDSIYYHVSSLVDGLLHAGIGSMGDTKICTV